MGGVDEIVTLVRHPGQVEGVPVEPVIAPHRALLYEKRIVPATDIDSLSS
jgi:hypothetical protein